MVYIIIVNWNGWQDTLECLESLLLLSFAPYTIVVCDNGSTDGSLSKIRDWSDLRGIGRVEYDAAEAETGGAAKPESSLVLIRNGANLGFAGGNNVGLRYALAQDDFSYAWLLNNDTVVDPDALTFLVQRFGEHPLVGMCGSTLRLYGNPAKIQALGGGCYCRWIGLPWHYGRFTSAMKKPNQRRAERWMNYVEGASMMLSRRFLTEIGLMCEDYFLYFEELDWAIRAEGCFQIAYAPQSIVYHKVGRSIGTSSNPGKKSYTCDYFNVRNRILFTRRFYPAALPTVYLVLLGALLIRLLLGRWDRFGMILRLLLGYPDRRCGMVSDRSES